MERYLKALVFVLSLHFGLVDAHAAAPSDSWTETQVNPLENIQGSNDKTIANLSCGSACNFVLHYFIGGRPVRDTHKKNILFISGGPGQVMKRIPGKGEKRFLDFLEQDYNVYYFDIRGAGFSAIDLHNRFDTALRAANVVTEIEQVRIKELGATGSWDAVYGHSHGTIVAQLYAASSPPQKPVLKKLILSAPLWRFKDFEEARIEMLVKIFKSILETYRHQTESQNCPPEAPSSVLVTPTGGFITKGTDNFCFLTTESDGMVDKLTNKFKDKLHFLSDNFGSVAFVAEYFKDLGRDLAQFPAVAPYPPDFYLALQRLSFIGGTESQPLAAVDNVRDMRVNSAFILGYYLAFDENKDFKQGADLFPQTQSCRNQNPLPPFLDGVTNHSNDDKWIDLFCNRHLVASHALTSIEGAALQSDRANLVYGLNDGINHFIFAILNVNPTPSGCIESKPVKDFASDTGAGTHKDMRALVRQVGIDLNKQICLWNPDTHKHDISTLIFKGGADPIISGCQAEKVFTNALTGERALFDFPGVGHTMRWPNFVPTSGPIIDGDKALLAVVNTFLEKSFEDFTKDSSVKFLVDHSVDMHIATGPGSADICTH